MYTGMNKDASKTKTIATSVSYVTVIMILSRMLAFVSNQIALTTYGTGGYMDIYSYVTTIPNTIFNVFGTALGTVVIPIYAGHLAKGEDKEAARFANNIITISTAFTAVLVLIGIGLSPLLPLLTSFNSGEEYSFAVKALMAMMPIMIFYGLNYIFQGILQSRGKYGWPAFVSVPSSLVVIIYVFTLGDKYGVAGLLAATFIGLSLQALILIPPAIASGFRYRPSFEIKNEDLITAYKMTLPIILGVSAYQFNMFFNAQMIANFDGMVSLTNTVQHMVVYMVLAFVYSVTAVVYPRLSASVSKGNMDEYKQTISVVLKAMTALLLPVTFGFIAVRRPLLQLVLNWGEITDTDINRAVILLVIYSVSIIGVGLKEVIDRAFYAIKSTIIPAVNGVVIMVVNVVLGIVLINFFGAYGIPAAYSAAAIIGLIVQLILLKKKIGTFCPGLGADFIKCLISSIAMAAAATAAEYGMDMLLKSDGVAMRIIKLGVPVAIGVIVYAILVIILKVSVVSPVIDKVKSILKK